MPTRYIIAFAGSLCFIQAYVFVIKEPKVNKAATQVEWIQDSISKKQINSINKQVNEIDSIFKHGIKSDIYKIEHSNDLISGQAKMDGVQNPDSNTSATYSVLYYNNKAVAYKEVEESESGDSQNVTIHYFNKSGRLTALKLEYSFFDQECIKDRVLRKETVLYYVNGPRIVQEKYRLLDESYNIISKAKCEFHYIHRDNEKLAYKYKDSSKIPILKGKAK